MKFKMGDKVRKTSGGKWRGAVVGTYSTELTPEGYTAVDMATARAEGFRDGQAAVEQALAQDEREAPVVVATAILGGLFHGGSGPELGEIDIEVCTPALETIQCETVNSSDDVFLPLMTVAQHERIVASLTRPAQTAPQGKFRMGDLVKKSTGSEWEGRVVGWYSTEQTKEGYAVESSAHRNSVQIYPARALEAWVEPAPAQDDLRARCAEILEWQQTGVLRGDALRNFAASQPYARDSSRLQMAEADTAREAYQFVVQAKAAEPSPAQTEQQPVAVPESWWQLIHDTLRNYHMSTLEDGYGGGYPLIDAMTADGQSVSGGIEECTYLADAIWNALRAAPIAQTAPHESEHHAQLLGQALGECIAAAGIIRPDASLSGPELLMFADDLKRHLAEQAAPQPVAVPEGHALVPITPTEAQWSGLARDLMMWLDMSDKTAQGLFKHLRMLGVEPPQWLRDEPEMQGAGVPSKGARVTLIYRAMIEDYRAALSAQGGQHE